MAYEYIFLQKTYKHFSLSLSEQPLNHHQVLTIEMVHNYPSLPQTQGEIESLSHMICVSLSPSLPPSLPLSSSSSCHADHQHDMRRESLHQRRTLDHLRRELRTRCLNYDHTHLTNLIYCVIVMCNSLLIGNLGGCGK